ncbi:hypothetical protein [Gordonia terrae]|uniref:hypothetical protein n=1 Tax=Gordonia terrae TaxID=2055 RepID=UPI003F6B9B18
MKRSARDDHEADFYDHPHTTQSWRRRIGVGATAAVLGGLVVATTVGLAHADETTTTPSTSASSSTGADVSTVIAEASTDKIGLVSISQVAATGGLVPNAVIHLERRVDTAAPAPSTSIEQSSTSAQTTTSAQLPTPDEAGGGVGAKLAFPVGTSLDVITTTTPIVLALPEGAYTLTHLGTAGTDNTGPAADPVTLRITAGAHANGALREQPTSSAPATPAPATN